MADGTTDRTSDRTTVPQPADRGTSAYIAEFIGTFGLVFFVTMAVSVFVTPAQPGLPEPFIDWSVIGLVHVFVLFMLIQALALVSGAHFNPAVTVALTVIREIKPIDAAIYIVVQLAGATLAALATKAILVNAPNAEAVDYGAVGIGNLLDGQIFFHGLSVEMLGTFFLVFAIVGVAVNPRSDRGWAALAIGATLGFLVMCFGPLTGAGFNPAITVGMTVVRQIKPIDAAIYILMQCAGATLGALTTKALIPDDIGEKVNWGATNLAPTIDRTVEGMGAEALGTFFLVWAVMGVAVNPTAVKDWSGLVIGGTLGFAVMIIAPLTGAGFNPARSLGPAIVGESFDGVGKWLLVYTLAPLVGALIAVFLYSWLITAAGKKGVTGAEPVG